MNSSLWSANRTTHIKIVFVALLAAIVIVGVGMNARQDEWASSNSIAAKASGPVLRASKPTNITANDIFEVR